MLLFLQMIFTRWNYFILALYQDYLDIQVLNNLIVLMDD